MGMMFVNDADMKIVGTSLQGYVSATYNELVTAFGEPGSTGGSWMGQGTPPFYADYDAGDKVTAEWMLAFAVAGGDPEDCDGGIDKCDSVVATIYDYKTGYTPMELYDWHVGGNDQDAVRFVQSRLDEVSERKELKEHLEEVHRRDVKHGLYSDVV